MKMLRDGCRLAMLVAALLPWAASASAQAPAPSPSPALNEAVQKEMQAAQELLARAQAEFDGPQQSRSIVLFEQIIERLEVLRRQGSLPPRGREILASAYELRGRGYYNIGLQEKASDSFRSLVQLQPQYALSKERVSPKIVEFFNSTKKALVGYVAVSSKPAGARVTLNGEFLALTDFFPLEVLAGEYTVEVTRDGYRTETRTVSIAPKATEAIQVELVRTSASAFFITQPAGVEVWVDDELKTTTGGGLAPDAFDAARARGLDPAKASGRTEVANLSLGSHRVELRKKCYETVKTTVELPEASDYEIPPAHLEESLASLQLRSEPPGAKIFLDGEAMGQTPRDIEGVCSGRHRLEVKHVSGKFIQDLVLAKDESLGLDCPIRPSLAFLGVVAESPAGERVLAEVEEKLNQNLSKKVHSLNFIPAPKETVDRALEAEKLTRRQLVPGPGAAPPDAVRKVTESLGEKLEVQGFLLAILPDERLQRTAVLHVLAKGNTVSDPWEVIFNEEASYLRFVSALDQKATVYRPWSGLITVDTLLHEGVPVLRVVPGSPAAQAQVRPGEVLTAVDGKPVKASIELIRAVEAKKAKDKLGLGLKGAAGDRVVDLTLAETPQEIPLNDPTLFYNKVMMDLLQQVIGYPGTESAAFARLNLAICAMHFGDFAAAHDHLLKAKGELPARPGLSQGTALYYLGLALERLGYRKEAVESYRSAAGSKDATLFNNDGPAVAPLASRRAGP
jgi:tetratricopeptide (TPR) repeat protein